MKNLAFILTSCIFAFSNTAFAQKTSADSSYNPCAQYTKTPKLNLSSSFGKLRYDFSHSDKQLQIMSRKQHLPHNTDMYMSGLSLCDMDWSFSLNSITKIIDDIKCVIPTSIDVFVGYISPVIYINKELSPNTCTYKVALRHEQQHQQINIAVLEYYLPTIKSKMEKALSVLKAMPIEEDQKSSEVVEKLNMKYAETIRPIINRFQITLQIEQEKLDRRDNYLKESELCQ
ncbi:MAG: hypothetical protein J6Y53_03750 [Alphaproteobacteria bacterium]|nr:hypothetical protein [Alphaproteobacteria bacterium]